MPLFRQLSRGLSRSLSTCYTRIRSEFLGLLSMLAKFYAILRGRNKSSRATVNQFLARTISTAKWNEREIGGNSTVPANGITSDMRLTDDCLSFWTCDRSQSSSLEQVVLALAAARDTVDRLDLVWLGEASIKNIPLRIVATEGDTPAQALKDRHRDVADIDLGTVYGLAQHVAQAVNGS